MCSSDLVDLDTMSGEDLGLSVERCVIAVFADQHMGQQCGARQSLGDRSFRCWGLMDRPARAAAVLRPADAQHAQACRHEVEHLADALTDRMKSAAATGTDCAGDVACYIFTRQAIRQRLTSWCRFGTIIIDARRQRRAHPGNVDIEVFETERKLIIVQPLRSPAELRALQALNNRLETVHLGARSLQFVPLIGGLRG